MTKKQDNKWAFWLFAALAGIYAAFFFAKPINLATADLGRHIVNGELLLQGVTEVLYTNHYSFTEPDHAFVNHHWASGVAFHWVNEAFGFKGLSVLYLLLNVVALGFVVAASKGKSGPSLPILAALTVVPLLAYRVEVRPEGFSYALIAIYFFLFARFRSGEIPFKRLLMVLLPLQLLWVNLHIFFVLGIMVAGAFLLDAIVNKRETVKQLALTIGGLVAISLINPHTYKGLLAPFTIFTEYGYMVAENQSILFMHERFGNPELYHFELFGVIAIGLVALLTLKKWLKPLLAEVLLVVAFGVLSAMAVRGIPLFALFFVPLLTAILDRYIDAMHFKTRLSAMKAVPFVGIAFCVIFLGVKGTYASAQKGYEGLGLITDIDRCGKFLKREKLPGRMFNNYDFGGYLIYYLHDREKVFVDNRPEAYSVAFFDSIYKPMQEDDAIWQAKSLEYGINSIVFFRHDNTPWAQPFLIRRTQDPEWVPVYVDEASLVLIRNSEANRPWIERLALPREMFRGIPN